jgi:hypothetical protein
MPTRRARDAVREGGDPVATADESLRGRASLHCQWLLVAPLSRGMTASGLKSAFTLIASLLTMTVPALAGDKMNIGTTDREARLCRAGIAAVAARAPHAH